MAEWFYLSDEGKTGPVDEAELRRLVAEYRLSGCSMIRSVSGDDWGRLDGLLPEFADGLPNGPTPIEAPEGAAWQDTRPHPWRRLFARLLDMVVVGSVSWYVFSFVLAAVYAPAARALIALWFGPAHFLVDGVLSSIGAIPGEALLIGLTGTSFGKWIFGVRILGRDGRPIGFPAALAREFEIWWKGLVLALPFLVFIGLFIAYRQLGDTGAAAWDRPAVRVAVHRPASGWQTALNVLGVGLYLVLSILLRLPGSH